MNIRDRAKFDASSSAYVTYSVAASTDAPASLTFGPSFIDLAATYPGTAVMGQSDSCQTCALADNIAGLNRGHDDITNTIAAAKVANEKMDNLLAIELGNEPECQSSLLHPIFKFLTQADYFSNKQPIALSSGSWTPSQTHHPKTTGPSSSAPPCTKNP